VVESLESVWIENEHVRIIHKMVMTFLHFPSKVSTKTEDETRHATTIITKVSLLSPNSPYDFDLSVCGVGERRHDRRKPPLDLGS
jgi:hypothetical protein